MVIGKNVSRVLVVVRVYAKLIVYELASFPFLINLFL